MHNHADHVDHEGPEEKDEPLVVAVAHTVVDERAVVVETLNALVAVVAVTGLFGP